MSSVLSAGTTWVTGGYELGPELAGRRWTVEGMSYLAFDGLTVIREADYHDAKSRERSLRGGLAAWRPRSCHPIGRHDSAAPDQEC